jgi:uncharacterized protein
MPAAPMATRLAILLWHASEADPAKCAAPFVYAAVAAAMDAEVEVHFSGASVRLLVPGVAEQLFPGRDRSRSLYRFMQDAAEHGARFVGCSMAEQEHLEGIEGRIPEYSRVVGAAAFIQRTLDPEWRTLVF